MVNEIFEKYFGNNFSARAIPFGNGHINDTYLVDIEGKEEKYILQKINTNVFPDPDGIVITHRRLQELIFAGERPYSIARIYPNLDGGYLTRDETGGCWRMTAYIDGSYTIDTVETEWQAHETGAAFGWFAKKCNVLKPGDFREAIKNFHNLPFRISQLHQAIADDKANRLYMIPEIIAFYDEREERMQHIQELVDTGKIPVRIVHNDTKINNLLFVGNKAKVIIDLDTVGPGILYYDYGDALRTSACTTKEDEQDLTRVDFNMNAFEQFSKAYLHQVSSILTKEEEENFHLAPVLLTYIMGIRFLTDYLNGDTYYKTSYPEHNLVRSKVQMQLIKAIEKRENQMIQMIRAMI